MRTGRKLVQTRITESTYRRLVASARAADVSVAHYVRRVIQRDVGMAYVGNDSSVKDNSDAKDTNAV